MLYTVAHYPGVLQQINALIEQAVMSGIRSIVVGTLKEMVLHLQTHPLDWGDPDYTMDAAGGVVSGGGGGTPPSGVAMSDWISAWANARL